MTCPPTSSSSSSGTSWCRLALLIETNYAPPVALQLAIYLPMTFIASLLLLQPVKGTVVGLQWALRMHGFDENAVEVHSAGLANLKPGGELGVE